MTEEVVTRKPSLVMAVKYRLAIASVFLTGLVGFASAEINLSAMTEMIDAIVGIIPSLVDLMIAVIPLIFIGMMISFIVGLLAAILGFIKINI